MTLIQQIEATSATTSGQKLCRIKMQWIR